MIGPRGCAPTSRGTSRPAGQEVRGRGPARERPGEVTDPASPADQPQQTGAALRQAPAYRAGHHPARAGHGDRLAARDRGPRPCRLHVTGAQVDQHPGDVDAHRAGVEAGAAQRRRVRQRGVALLPSTPVSCGVRIGPDRARIHRPVRVPAGAFVDGAHVQAGAAADAVQRLAADLVGQDGGAPVVEQDEMELLRPVAGCHPGPHRGVRVHPLAGRRARQQLEEHLQVAPASARPSRCP